MNYILVEDFTNIIKHRGFRYTLLEDRVKVRDDEGNLKFVFGTLNKYNCKVYELSYHIDDFIGNKYMYVDEEVILNPDYVEEE